MVAVLIAVGFACVLLTWRWSLASLDSVQHTQYDPFGVDRAAAARQSWQQEIANAQPARVWKGDGIVTTAGWQQLGSVWVLVHVLRVVHRCMLPLELWHNEELSEADCAQFPVGLKVRCRSLAEATSDGAAMPLRSGYQIKALSILHSSFRRMIFLDNDNVPMGDPCALLHLREFNDTGALFWPYACVLQPLARALPLMARCCGPIWCAAIMVLCRWSLCQRPIFAPWRTPARSALHRLA